MSRGKKSRFKIRAKTLRIFLKNERNITCDNFFTNLELGRKLLMQNFTIVGTIRKNRTELPAEFVSTKDRKESITLYGYQKEATIVSYYIKKGKVVTLLSTMHSDKGIESPVSEKKPDIITYYNATNGVVDTMDQMVIWFTSKRKTRRWSMVIFCHMLDISPLNAFITLISLKKENHAGKRGNRLRRSLLISLAKGLAELQDKDTIQIQASSSENTSRRKRCSMCLCVHVSCSMCPLLHTKRKPFVKPVAIMFAVITLLSFAGSVVPNNFTVSHLFTFFYCHFCSLQSSMLE